MWINTNYSNFKLLPDWKHPLFHGKTVRNNISKHLWLNKIRKYLLETYDYTCSICGYKGAPENARYTIHVHEVEEYDFDNLVCHLRKLELVCVKCHNIHHFKRALQVLNQEQLIDLAEHFMKVNHCKSEDLMQCYRIRQKQDMEFIQQCIENADARQNRGKRITFTVHEDVLFHDEIVKQLGKKGLLYLQ